MSKKGGKDGGGQMDKEKELGKLYKELGALRCHLSVPEFNFKLLIFLLLAILKHVSFQISGRRRILTQSRKIGRRLSR